MLKVSFLLINFIIVKKYLVLHLFNEFNDSSMTIKRSILFVFVLLTIFSCGGKKNRGELIGVKQKKWFPEKPYGMTLVEGGAFIMGKSDEDVAQLNNAAARTVTVPSFYMDETEITNGEYRQFVYWVKDSVTMDMLARKIEEDPGEEGNTEAFSFIKVAIAVFPTFCASTVLISLPLSIISSRIALIITSLNRTSNAFSEAGQSRGAVLALP